MDTNSILPQLLLQFALIAVNALFAATEIAVISLNETKVRRMAEDGDKKSAAMLRMVTEPTGFLSTIQICITLAGFLGSAFAADNFSDKLVNWLINDCSVTGISAAALDTISVIIITLILSYFTLVFGELVPKRIAMKRADGIARAVSGLMIGMSAVLKPIIWLLTVSTNAVLRLCGVDPNDTIEDVKVSDVAAFVCVNTPRYIPKFKSISVRRSKSGWNWSGFIFSYLWLFFRKCWVEGIVALVSSFVSFFMTAPLMIAYSSAVQPYLSTAGSFNSGEVTAAMMKALSSAGTGMWALFIAGALLSLLTHLFVGLRGDIIYMRHALSKIKKISADSLLDDRQAMIVKAGGVNIFVVLIVFYGAKLIQNLVLQMLMAL